LSCVRIIGVGSPIGNDSIGWAAIDGLEQLDLQRQYPNHQITLEKLDRPGPALLEQMRGADHVIIIDALMSDGETEEIVFLRLDEIARQQKVLSGHGLGVAETIALGDVLGDLPERLLLLGITVKQADEPSAGYGELAPETMVELQRCISECLF
jgi:hydrogenase maturation protease